MLYYNADGDYYEDMSSRGDVCPSGSTWMGGSYYGAPVCGYDGYGVVTSIYSNLDDEVFDYSNGPDMCASGWEFVGSWYGWAQCR